MLTDLLQSLRRSRVIQPEADRLTTVFQPRRLMIPPAAIGCKSFWQGRWVGRGLNHVMTQRNGNKCQAAPALRGPGGHLTTNRLVTRRGSLSRLITYARLRLRRRGHGHPVLRDVSFMERRLEPAVLVQAHSNLWKCPVNTRMVELNHVGSPDSTKTTLGRRFAGQGSLRLGWRAVAAIFLGLLTLYHRLAARG